MTWWGQPIDQMTPEERVRLRSTALGGGIQGAVQAAGSPGFAMAAPAQALAMLLGGGMQGARQGANEMMGRQVQGAQLHHMQTMDTLSEQQAQLEQLKVGQAMAQQDALNKGIDAYGQQHPEAKDQLTLLRYLDPSKAADVLSGGNRQVIGTPESGIGVYDKGSGSFTKLSDPSMTQYQKSELGLRQADIGLRQNELGMRSKELNATLGLKGLEAQKTRAELNAMQGGAGLTGQSPDAQMLNRVAMLDRKVRAAGGKWEALTPDEQADYRTFHDHLTAPKTSFDPTTGQATTTTSPLSGYFTPPPPPPVPDGGQGGAAAPSGTVPLPGGGTATTTQVTPGTQKVPPLAGLVPGALEDIGRLRGAFVNPDGSVNRSAIYATNPPGQSIPLLGRALEGGLPGTQGTELHPSFLRAADALLRIKTGAQANESEIAQLARSYMPSTGDTDAAVRQKLDALERDLRNAGGALTSGVVNPALKLQPAAQPGGTPQTAQPAAPQAAKPGQAPAGLKLNKADVDATAKAHGKTVDETLGMWAHINGVSPDEARRLYEGG